MRLSEELAPHPCLAAAKKWRQHVFSYYDLGGYYEDFVEVETWHPYTERSTVEES